MQECLGGAQSFSALLQRVMPLSERVLEFGVQDEFAHARLRQEVNWEPDESDDDVRYCGGERSHSHANGFRSWVMASAGQRSASGDTMQGHRLWAGHLHIKNAMTDQHTRRS